LAQNPARSCADDVTALRIHREPYAPVSCKILKIVTTWNIDAISASGHHPEVSMLAEPSVVHELIWLEIKRSFSQNTCVGGGRPPIRGVAIGVHQTAMSTLWRIHHLANVPADFDDVAYL
jgi:hypothetical protein